MNGLFQWLRRPPVACTVLFVLAVACTSLVQPQHWDGGNGPVVPHAGFPADCSLCHIGNGWSEIREDFEYDHEKETGVALEGAHAAASCLRCHNDRGPVEMFASRGCSGCHVDPHRGQVGKQCDDCHGQNNWQPREAIARHDRTRFPLVGVHVAVACYRCHPGAQVGNFAGADSRCESCHADDLVRATSPNHVANGWTQDCQQCHLPFGWRPAQFVHTAAFPLVGAHAGRNCSDCHTGGTFTGLTNDCAACHLPAYQAAQDPNHVAAAFDTDCSMCHSTISWDGGTFSHPPSFPLTGAHFGVDCLQCHQGNVFAGLPSNCSDCHLDEYQGTTDPNHVTAGFATSCETCHSTIAWGGAAFTHPATFPLTGAHVGVDCLQCHQGNVFAGLPSNCSDCHLDDYQATTSPPHAAQGFPTNCETCHSTATWSGAVFNHAFPIQAGNHAGLSCADCHSNLATPTQITCINCHEHQQPETDADHDEVPGYVYSSPSCLACHPTGN